MITAKLKYAVVIVWYERQTEWQLPLTASWIN